MTILKRKRRTILPAQEGPDLLMKNPVRSLVRRLKKSLPKSPPRRLKKRNHPVDQAEEYLNQLRKKV